MLIDFLLRPRRSTFNWLRILRSLFSTKFGQKRGNDGYCILARSVRPIQVFNHNLIAPATMPSVMTLPSHISAIHVNRFQRGGVGSLSINDSHHGRLCRETPNTTRLYKQGSGGPSSRHPPA